eukprot:TRINITY_DN5926_c0_g1_i1.p1 TRINITY_DN5926_c0_g1~~TRINITY_DN5926_c0_g1_i1.p1  ORF type:complete len:860 (+),score=192.46 TRINITY_DN5926_c0_g1_i1:204-2783(+)
MGRSHFALLAVVCLGVCAGLQMNPDDLSVQVLGDADPPLDPSSADNAGLPGTKVLLKLEGNPQAEEFPLVTLEKLQKKVNQAAQEDAMFKEQQHVACEQNRAKFKEAQEQAAAVAKQGKEVLQQCHERRLLATASWKSSREEEREQTKEADTALQEKQKSAVDFGLRSVSNQVILDLLLKAGHYLCDLLPREIIPETCKTLYEEKDFPESKELFAGLVSDNATLEEHRLESEKYEASKQAEFEALSAAPEPTPEAAQKDPDENGFPQRLGEARLSTRRGSAHIEQLITQASQYQRPMVSQALESVLLAIKQGVFSGTQGAKKAEGVVGLVSRIRKQVADAYAEDRKTYPASLALITDRMSAIFEQLVKQRDTQHRLTNELLSLDNRTVKATNLLDWADAKVAEAAKALHQETHRCAGVKERIRLRNAERREVLVRIHRVRDQISLKPTDAPYCEGGCNTNSTPSRGTCVELDGKPARCLCTMGFYGDHCQHTMCPGFGGGKFQADMQGACSGGVCDSQKGVCSSCQPNEYSGALKACELKKCPSVDCSGHGQCDAEEGKCQCHEGWSGDKCHEKTCAGPENKFYAPSSHNSCSGRGVCNPDTGECSCKQPFMGAGCEQSGCLNDCSGHGSCDAKQGKCICEEGFRGPACELKNCPNDCSGNGLCNRLSGWCDCKRGYTGEDCGQATGCTKEVADWWTTFDHEGWGVCPKGTLLQGLYRNDCEGLACIETAQCVTPCAGDTPLESDPGTFGGETGMCYHHSFHDSFDSRGWSRCHQGFFLAGIYRSKSDSLYGLQMGKCCAIAGQTWDGCSEADWSVSWQAKGWSAVPRNKFITGFFRDGPKHVLSTITKASACGFTKMV